METNKRLKYIDNACLFVIMLVVVLQLSLTYGGSGSWYYTESRMQSGSTATFFRFFQTFLQSFSMGFLFLIAGYFVPQSYERKGFAAFLKCRALHLGIPVLLYMLVIDPALRYALLDEHNGFFTYYLDNIVTLRFLSGSGPLWFALALLVFSCVYAVSRRFTDHKRRRLFKSVSPGFAELALLVLIIGLLTFLLRIPFPCGTVVFGIPLSYFAQYIVLFIAGLLAYRYDLFNRLSHSCIGLLYTLPLWGPGVWVALMMAVQGFWRSNYALLDGGGWWQSLIFALWEAFTAVAMCAGLLVLFRDYAGNQTRLTQEMSKSAGVVYVIYAPIVTVIALLFQTVGWAPFAKFVAMIPVCLTACFVVSYLLTKVSLYKRLL